MTESSPAASPATCVPSLGELFTGFLIVTVSAFGGILPFARRMVVEQRRWLTPAEFTDLLALGQFLPGPNIVNVSICIGQRFHGWRGSLAAVLGLMAAPVAIILVLGLLFASFGEIPLVRRAVFGMAAAAAGLVLATGAKMAWPFRRRLWPLLVIAGVAACVAFLRWPLVWILAVAVPLAVACAWYEARAARRASPDR